MVPPLLLLEDVLSIAGFFLMLPAMLAVLYLVAWREIGVAEKIGVNRDVFWLLLLGGSVGWVGNIPIFLWGNSIMAVNMGGALAPVTVSLFLLARYFRPDTPGGTVYVIGGWAEASVISVFLLIFGFPWFYLPLVFALGALAVYTVSGRGYRPTRGSLVTVGQYSMLATATVGTYLTTYVVLGSGIVSPFPFVLLPPVLVAAMSVLFLRGDTSAPGLAYATATLGCMIGADFLHQPELYAPGVGAFFGAIGGAGPLDLVYLSGLLSMSTALLLLPVARYLRSNGPQSKELRQASPLRRAVSSYERGYYSAVGGQVLEGLHEEAESARRLLNLDIPGAPSEGPVRFDGFHFHPAVQQDYDSLMGMVVQGTPSRESSWKALVSGFFLARALEEACKSRLALPMDRAKAFLLDLASTVGPAAMLLFVLYRTMHLNGVVGALASLDYQAAIYGAASYPILVFWVSEWRTGSSLGKWLLHIEVVGRDLERPGLLETLGRNITKLVGTTSLALAVGLAISYGSDQGGILGVLFGSVIIVTGTLGALATGWIGLGVMSSTHRRRRLGDLMVGTQVIRTVEQARFVAPLPMPSPLPPVRA